MKKPLRHIVLLLCTYSLICLPGCSKYSSSIGVSLIGTWNLTANRIDYLSGSTVTKDSVVNLRTGQYTVAFYSDGEYIDYDTTAIILNGTYAVNNSILTFVNTYYPLGISFPITSLSLDTLMYQSLDTTCACTPLTTVRTTYILTK